MITFDDFIYDVNYLHKNFTDLNVNPEYTKLRVSLLKPYFGLDLTNLKTILKNPSEANAIERILDGDHNFYSINFPYMHSLEIPSDSVLIETLQTYFPSIVDANAALESTRSDYISSLLNKIVEDDRKNILVKKSDLIDQGLPSEVEEYDWHVAY